MTAAQRARIDELKRRRAQLENPIDRIAFDNDPANGTAAERIVAMTESDQEPAQES